MSAELPGRLPIVPATERARLLAAPATREVHDRLLAELRLDEALETAPPPRPVAPAPDSLRVVAWNVERGRPADEAAALLEEWGADVVLASELDVGMARSGQRHTVREIAERLGLGFAYGVEFLELEHGNAEETARCAGRANEVGYHGNAILSRLPLVRPALLRLEREGAWFTTPGRGQRRVGGRMAVLAEIALGGGAVTLAAVHFESYSDPALRDAQLRVLLDGIDARAPSGPALVGGDLNTCSMALVDLGDPAAASRAIAADPDRLHHPVPHEPLFASAEKRGYAWSEANLHGESTHRRSQPRPSSRGDLKLDWFLARGLDCAEPAVLEATRPGSGEPLSDHEAIACTIRPR